jgi:hypothetical protein
MKPFVKCGVWTGIVSGLWGLGCFTIVGWLNSVLFSRHIQATDIRSYSGLFSILILIVGIYIGIRQAKRKTGGIISFGQAVKTGALIACVAAVIVAIFSWFYCTVINPGYAEFMVQDTSRALYAAGKSSQEIGVRLAAVRKEFSTGRQLMEALVGQAVVGAVVSMILGAFMRTRKP